MKINEKKLRHIIRQELNEAPSHIDYHAVSDAADDAMQSLTALESALDALGDAGMDPDMVEEYKKPITAMVSRLDRMVRSFAKVGAR